jgi:hypothetical protein
MPTNWLTAFYPFSHSKNIPWNSTRGIRFLVTSKITSKRFFFDTNNYKKFSIIFYTNYFIFVKRKRFFIKIGKNKEQSNNSIYNRSLFQSQLQA